jgi:acyl-CoA reductase-like NAD-dependent aldehyde dehydrogenase
MSAVIQGRNFVGGEWVAGPNLSPDINPSDTTQVVGEFPRASRADAEQAIAAAKAAVPKWSQSTPQERTGGGKDAARGNRRDGPRRADLPVLCR